MELHLSPADGRLRYSGYVTMELEATRAHFSRQYGTYTLQDYGPAAIENGGTRISWRAASERITVQLEYTLQCRASCSLNLDSRTCYGGGSHALSGARCSNQCDATLLLDGKEVDSPGLRLR